jgi:1,4-dihydroxy-2-naphthoyl-CoA synthase
MLVLSPTALKLYKMGFNADSERLVGGEELSELAIRLYWGSAEAEEARTALAERRAPDLV